MTVKPGLLVQDVYSPRSEMAKQSMSWPAYLQTKEQQDLNLHSVGNGCVPENL
jgi:hypothetical protein